MPTTPVTTFSGQKLQPKYPGARTFNVAFAPSQNIARGTVLGETTVVNDVQTVTENGAPTGGTFTLTFNGQTTTALAQAATAAQVQAALGALPNIGVGNVNVSGSAGGPWTVTFVGALAGQTQNVMTATGSFTGGTTPTVTVAHTTSGAAGQAKAYASGNSDGSQIPKWIAEYDMQVDANSNITYSSTTNQSGGYWGQTYLSAPVFETGDFDITELTGLDANAVSVANWHMVEGSIASGVGIVRLP